MRPVESRPVRVDQNLGGIFLLRTAGLRFQEREISPEMVREDSHRWQGIALLTGTNNYRLGDDDETILRKALCELTPLVILGRRAAAPLVLQAELRRFPYTVDGETGYEAFGVRLMPLEGEIAHVIRNDNPHGVTVREGEKSSELISIDVGERVHVQLFLARQDHHFLPPLTPPATFQEDVRTLQFDY